MLQRPFIILVLFIFHSLVQSTLFQKSCCFAYMLIVQLQFFSNVISGQQILFPGRSPVHIAFVQLVQSLSYTCTDTNQLQELISADYVLGFFLYQTVCFLAQFSGAASSTENRLPDSLTATFFTLNNLKDLFRSWHVHSTNVNSTIRHRVLSAVLCSI